MKLLSICDPTQYKRPPLDVPAFYRHLSRDPRVTFYHLPTPWVGQYRQPHLRAVPSAGLLSYEAFVSLGQQVPVGIALSEIDVVFCRTLKPFPPGYLDELSTWENATRFVNRPSSKRSQIQSDFLLAVARDYMPEAIATADSQQALAFFEQFQTIVAKRPNSCGGHGVFKIEYRERAFWVDNIVSGARSFAQFSQVMDYIQAGRAESLQFCRFLPRTTAGDKRVVVVDGEIYGSYLRRSKSGHWVNNVSGDGDCILAGITAAERAAIAHTVGCYRALGLHTLGYDFLLDDDGTWRISEINAGNIGGFARLELLTGRPVMARLVDWLLDYARRPPPSPVSSPRASRHQAASNRVAATIETA